MKVRPYTDEDFEMIQGWLDDRDHPRFKAEYLPHNGWIVDGLAAIFLLNADSKLGFLDFFVTNPQSDGFDRLEACDLLIIEAEKRSRELGHTAIVGSTKILKVQALGLRYGFGYDPTPYYCFFKPLGESPDERRNNVHSSPDRTPPISG